MDHELEQELGLDVLNSKVITRTGSPVRMCDLQKVATGRASTVILLLSPESVRQERQLSAETLLAGALTNINSLSRRPQTLLVTSSATYDFLEDITRPQGASHGSTVSHLLGDMSASKRFNIMYIPSLLRRLSESMAQCAFSPGLSAVITELMTHKPGSVELCVRQYSQLTGRSFGEARRQVKTGTLIGTVNKRTGWRGHGGMVAWWALAGA